MEGISVKSTIGIGDALQFSSLPENYFKATGTKLVDVSRPWFFDHNPFVARDVPATKVTELWNFSPTQYQWPNPRGQGNPAVYLSNAEVHASVFGVPVVLNRPRLYRFEDYPFGERTAVLLQTEGKSHGQMPAAVVGHILAKYPNKDLFHIGPGEAYGLTHLDTPDLWALAEVISKCRMLIGMDSGPAWIGACYPDVIVKKIRVKPTADAFKDWVPLAINNIHSHWDDRCHQIFNTSEEDIGFTSSYRRL